jgi:hypothetical protein
VLGCDTLILLTFVLVSKAQAFGNHVLHYVDVIDDETLEFCKVQCRSGVTILLEEICDIHAVFPKLEAMQSFLVRDGIQGK